MRLGRQRRGGTGGLDEFSIHVCSVSWMTILVWVLMRIRIPVNRTLLCLHCIVCYAYSWSYGISVSTQNQQIFSSLFNEEPQNTWLITPVHKTNMLETLGRYWSDSISVIWKCSTGPQIYTKVTYYHTRRNPILVSAPAVLPIHDPFW